MTQEITTINYNDAAVIRTLKETVARDLTDSEFRLFAEHCKGTGLNPFKKEVWAIKAGGRLQIMTGVNGYLAIANNHPQYDGMTVEVDNDEKPTKAVCKVYRKDRKHPAEGVALMREYGKDTPIWRQMPRVMLTKVAKSIAIREAFPQELNGTYTAEEMPPEYSETPRTLGTPVTLTHEPVKVTEVTEVLKGEKYYYELARVDVDKRDKAQSLVKANGGKMIYELGLVYECPVTIDKLAKYKISEDQAHGA
jgi:phage recombination protein Bet